MRPAHAIGVGAPTKAHTVAAARRVCRHALRAGEGGAGGLPNILAAAHS